jgi:hypothetical protein
MSVRARKYRHRVVGSHRDPSPYLAAAFLGLSLSPLLLPSLLLLAIKTHGTSATNAACTVPVLLTLPHRRSPILLHRQANPRLRRCIVLLLLVLSPRAPIRIAAAGVLRRDEPALLHRASAAPPRRGPAAPPGAPAPAHPCRGAAAGGGRGGAAQVGELREGVAVAVVRARGRGPLLLQAPRRRCRGGIRHRQGVARGGEGGRGG